MINDTMSRAFSGKGGGRGGGGGWLDTIILAHCTVEIVVLQHKI